MRLQKQMKYIFLIFCHLPCNMEILREIYFVNTNI